MTGPVKRSVMIGGHRTSVSLEPEFWAALKRLAEARSLSLASLITDIDHGRDRDNLSSAIRVYVLNSLPLTLPSPRNGERVQ